MCVQIKFEFKGDATVEDLIGLTLFKYTQEHGSADQFVSVTVCTRLCEAITANVCTVPVCSIACVCVCVCVIELV